MKIGRIKSHARMIVSPRELKSMMLTSNLDAAFKIEEEKREAERLEREFTLELRKIRNSTSLLPDVKGVIICMLVLWALLGFFTHFSLP